MGFFRNYLPFRRQRQSHFSDRLQGRQVNDLPAFNLSKILNGTFSAGDRQLTAPRGSSSDLGLQAAALIPRPAWPDGGPEFHAPSGGVNPPFGKVLLSKTLGTRLRRGGKAAGEPTQEPAAYRSSRK